MAFLRHAAQTVARIAESAFEVLNDPDLRRRGAALVVDEASRGLQQLHRGAGNRVKAALRDAERAAADLRRSLARQHARDGAPPDSERPSDVQVGSALLELAGPSVRRRLYAALARRPSVADLLQTELEARFGGADDQSGCQEGELGRRGALLEAITGLDGLAGGPDAQQQPPSTATTSSSREEEEGKEEEGSVHIATISGGVEAVEDAIARDVARTFPEHPMFSPRGDGQRRLGRLLKRYALRDPDTGYCQGQAFPAALLLVLANDEDAFSLYCRLLDAPPAGAGLRRLYSPGLGPLRVELAALDLLLRAHAPALHAHLAALGVSPVLYAAPWFLAAFASTFPFPFAARVLDALLQSRDDAVLPRVALALLEALQSELLAAHEFEAAAFTIKLAPLSWPAAVHRSVLDRALGPGLLSESALGAARAAAAAQLASAAATRVASLGSEPSGAASAVDSLDAAFKHAPTGTSSGAAAERSADATQAAAVETAAAAAAASADATQAAAVETAAATAVAAPADESSDLVAAAVTASLSDKGALEDLLEGIGGPLFVPTARAGSLSVKEPDPHGST